MKKILEKLQQISNNRDLAWDDWTIQEIQQLLQIYSTISRKEKHIFDVIYRYHECDSWEDIFRDYDMTYLKDKAEGVEIALTEVKRIVKKRGYIKPWWKFW